MSAGCCHAADCDQCFMLHVCMQGNSTASANAVSMALSQGAPSTAISQAVAQVVSPLFIYLLLLMDCLNSKTSAVIFGADKIAVMQTGSSAPASQVLLLWNSPMHGIVAWNSCMESMVTVRCLVVFVPQTQGCTVTSLLCCCALTEACTA